MYLILTLQSKQRLKYPEYPMTVIRRAGKRRKKMSMTFFENDKIARPVAMQILETIIENRLSYQQAKEALLIAQELMNETTCPAVMQQIFQ